jgi:hypothetical protein
MITSPARAARSRRHFCNAAFAAAPIKTEPHARDCWGKSVAVLPLGCGFFHVRVSRHALLLLRPRDQPQRLGNRNGRDGNRNECEPTATWLGDDRRTRRHSRSAVVSQQNQVGQLHAPRRHSSRPRSKLRRRLRRNTPQMPPNHPRSQLGQSCHLQ